MHRHTLLRSLSFNTGTFRSLALFAEFCALGGSIVGCSSGVAMPPDTEFGNESWEGSDGDEGTGADEDPEDEDGDDEDEDGDEGDEDGDGGDSTQAELVDPEDDGPHGRITFVGGDDGDFVLQATLGAEVAALYPNGHEYALRIDDENDAYYAMIVNGQGLVIEQVRFSSGDALIFPSDSPALQLCYPYPIAPPTEGCGVAPCPWQEDFLTEGGNWPDCLEITQDDFDPDMMHVIGAIEGSGYGFALESAVQAEYFFPPALSPEQEARIARAAEIGKDLATLQEELAEQGLHCSDCMTRSLAVFTAIPACEVEDPENCAELFTAHKAFQGLCEGVCG